MAIWLALFVALCLVDFGILDVALIASFVDAATTNVRKAAHIGGGALEYRG